MKGTTIRLRTQNQQGKNNQTDQSNSNASTRINSYASNNYSMLNKQQETKSPYKITIQTIYERGHINENKKLNDKPATQNKTHFQKLTAEERKKFNRGIRPSAAQREQDELAKKIQNQKDEMIEIIDKTNYAESGNKNIKLKPNKKVLINRKKEENQSNQKLNDNNPVNYRTNINQQNEDIKLIPNKKVLTKDTKPQSKIPVSSKRYLSKPVEKTNTNGPKPGFRNNTVSHTIIEKRKTENKPYVLNQRKNDKISFTPRMFQRYNDAIIGDKDMPYKSDNNHSFIVTKKVTREVRTVADLPDTKKIHHRYNYSQNPNLKNTYSHKIDATKKEPKKEVVVHPRKLIVIKSVIPSRRHLMTENNDNKNKNINQNINSRKIQTDQKPQSNMTKKIEKMKEIKDNQQRLQTRYNRNEIGGDNKEPQKIETRYNIPSTLSKPQQKPSFQYTREKPDYKKQNDNKYQVQSKPYNFDYSKTKTQNQSQPPKVNQYSTKRTQILVNIIKKYNRPEVMLILNL